MNKIKEIDDICKKYNIKNYVINSDGSVNIDGDVDLYNKKLKTIPLKFNIVSGNCNFRLNLLNSLKNSPVYVGRFFSCAYNKITSLKYSPKEINRYFNCGNNKLKTLEYGPKKVGGCYYCYNNYLIMLKGAPKIIYENFYCWGNKLTSLEYGPEIVYGNYDCSNNKLKNLKGCAKYINGELKVNDNPDLYSLEELMYCEPKDIRCENTIFYNVWRLFEDISKIELFNDMDIIREDASGKPIIILNRLNEFLDMIGKPRVEYVDGYINI